MEKILREMIGKRVEISGGGSAVYRGEVADVLDGVAHLRDDEGRVIYVAIDKIAAVSEKIDPGSRPGFII